MNVNKYFICPQAKKFGHSMKLRPERSLKNLFLNNLPVAELLNGNSKYFGDDASFLNKIKSLNEKLMRFLFTENK